MREYAFVVRKNVSLDEAISHLEKLIDLEVIDKCEPDVFFAKLLPESYEELFLEKGSFSIPESLRSYIRGVDDADVPYTHLSPQ